MSAVSLLSATSAAAGLPSLHLAMPGLPEMLVVLAIVVVLFGATKLPQLGKGMGEAIGNFKKAQRDAMRAEHDVLDATPKLGKDDAAGVEVSLEKKEERA
jgi:sec-independent protein translocase protein TatA